MTHALAIIAILLFPFVQARNFIPVEGGNLKAKVDNAIAAGRTNNVNGRFWIAYQFEVRPGVAIDFDVVDSAGGVYGATDSTFRVVEPLNETRDLGYFMLYDAPQQAFVSADVYNLRRNHEYGNYPVYWAGRVSNDESLNYLKSIVDSSSPQMNRLAHQAVYAISLHGDARVDAMLTDVIRRPASDELRSRAIHWLGNTPESQAKTALFTEIVRNNQENGDVRQAAMAALGMSRSAAALPVLENLYETLTQRQLRHLALQGIGRNDNSEGAATYLIRVAGTEKDVELRKSAISALGRVAGQKSLGALTSTVEGDAEVELQQQAVVAIGRRPKDEAIPILIRTARNHPRIEVRKTAIRVLGQTGDERATAFFRELLGNN